MSRDRTYPERYIQSFGTNNMTGTATVLGPVLDMLQIDKGGFEVQVVGNAIGVLTIEGSDRFDPVNNAAAIFVPLAAAAMNPALPAPAGASISYIGNLTAQALGCRFVRLRYVNTSGAGTLDVGFTGQGVS